MSRFRLISALVLFLASAPAGAALVNLSYWNWAEAMKISKGAEKLDAPANFAGIGVEYEVVPEKSNVGWAYAAALVNGTASGGSKTGPPVYFASYQRFNAVALKLNRFMRLYQRVYLEFGPMVMYRPFAWPTDGEATAESGSQFNFGASLNLRMRLAPRFDFCQSVGTLATNASTVWSLGFGFRF